MKMLISFKQLLRKLLLKNIFLSLQRLNSKRYSFGKKKFANLILEYRILVFRKYGKIQDHNEHETVPEVP